MSLITVPPKAPPARGPPSGFMLKNLFTPVCNAVMWLMNGSKEPSAHSDPIDVDSSAAIDVDASMEQDGILLSGGSCSGNARPSLETSRFFSHGPVTDDADIGVDLSNSDDEVLSMQNNSTSKKKKRRMEEFEPISEFTSTIERDATDLTTEPDDDHVCVIVPEIPKSIHHECESESSPAKRGRQILQHFKELPLSPCSWEESHEYMDTASQYGDCGRRIAARSRGPKDLAFITYPPGDPDSVTVTLGDVATLDEHVISRSTHHPNLSCSAPFPMHLALSNPSTALALLVMHALGAGRPSSTTQSSTSSASGSRGG
jgi:hypothetical protein